MKTIQFNESARDVEHDASVEVPSDERNVLVSTIDGEWTSISRYDRDRDWAKVNVHKWRELPAPPKPAPTIVPHSLEHWHDPKVERPEEGKKTYLHMKSGVCIFATGAQEEAWSGVRSWTYAPETAR